MSSAVAFAFFEKTLALPQMRKMHIRLRWMYDIPPLVWFLQEPSTPGIFITCLHIDLKGSAEDQYAFTNNLFPIL